MKTPRKRTLLVGAVVVLAAGGAVGGALAASGTFDPKAERQAFLDDAAGRLGVSSAKLEDALKQAAIDRVDAALAAGRITKDQADAMKAAVNSGRLPLGVGMVPGFHRGFHIFGPGLDAAAKYLGLAEDQLRTQLESGKTLADVAKAQGKSVDGLKQAMLSDIKAKLDQAVTDGRVTAAERDQALARISADLDSIVNGTPPPRPDRAFPGDGFRFEPGGFHGPPPADAPGAFLPTA